MPRLVIAGSAIVAPMGAQVYEEAIASRAAHALGADWQVDRIIARSVRSTLPGTHRLPVNRLGSAPAILRRATGRLLYARDAIVHRMNLELPPANVEVVTLHDVIAWKYADESAPVRSAVAEIKRAAAVICVSNYTAQEAVSFLGIEDPVVVPNGVGEQFFDARPLEDSVLVDLAIEAPYVLASGGASERKNLAALAAAWLSINSARPDLMLVLSGPDHPRRTELFGSLPRTRLLGRVSNQLMPGLIARAAALVIPSREEGFGLPALEAMAARTPVVAANMSSLPEVVGDGGLLVSPSAESIAEGVVHATSGEATIAQMVARGAERAKDFTWTRSINGHAAVWRRVHDMQ